MESVIFLNNNYIYARLFEPDKQNNNISIVIANSLFSENKHSRNFLINNARQLCSLGYRVLFFDYRGIGESKGDLLSINLKSLSEDLNAAISYVKENFNQSIILIGLRGGAIPVLSFSENPSVILIVLWEPVKKGSELIRFRNLITRQDNSSTINHNEDAINSYVNVGGWYINPNFHKELKQWQLKEQIEITDCKKLHQIFFIQNSDTINKDMLDSQTCVDCIVSEKFWYFGSKKFLVAPADITDIRIQSLLNNGIKLSKTINKGK